MTKARHDRLLAALIAKLPAGPDPWPRAERIAWLQMMATAFDVVYGPCGEIRFAPGGARGVNDDDGACAPLHGTADRHAATAAPPAQGLPQRFYVDRDGFAMADGRPVAMEDLPAGTVLWDERIGIECGDASAILWRDIGTSRRGLPPGVALQPVFDET